MTDNVSELSSSWLIESKILWIDLIYLIQYKGCGKFFILSLVSKKVGYISAHFKYQLNPEQNHLPLFNFWNWNKNICTIFIYFESFLKEKLIVTASIYDEKNLFGELTGGVKASSSQAAFILAMCDSTPENYYNLELIFRKLGFPITFDQNLQFVADYKLSNLVCRLYGCASVFSCIYGECSKQKDGMPCGNVKGRNGNRIIWKPFFMLYSFLNFNINLSPMWSNIGHRSQH